MRAGGRDAGYRRDVPSATSPALAAALRSAVTGWLSVLPADQRDLAQDAAGGEGAEVREWTYLPGPRPGLRLADMDGGRPGGGAARPGRGVLAVRAPGRCAT